MKSIRIPFSITNGRVTSTSDTSIAAEGKIINTMVTAPGERTGSPKFGAGTMRMLFEPLDPLVFADFRVEALQELKSRISSISILNLSVKADPSYGDNVARVDVTYQLPLGTTQLLTFRVVIPSAVTEETIL